MNGRPSTFNRLSQQIPGASPVEENSYGDDGGADILLNIPAKPMNPEVVLLRQRVEELQQQVASAIKRTDGGINILGCDASAAGLLIPDNIDEDRLTLLSDTLFAFEDRVQLYVGDMLVAAGKQKYGTIKSIATHYKRDPDTLSKWKLICGKVEMTLRRVIVMDYPDKKPLTITHYEKVMALNPERQEYFLRLAAQKEWSVARLQRAVNPKSKGEKTTLLERVKQGMAKRMSVWNKPSVDRDVKAALAAYLRECAADLERD